MKWLWNGQARTEERLASIERELEKLSHAFRQTEAEVAEQSERVLRTLKRLQAQQRRDLDGAAPVNQDRAALQGAGAETPLAPAPSRRSRVLWGARARRILREQNPQPQGAIDFDLDEMPNGTEGGE